MEEFPPGVIDARKPVRRPTQVDALFAAIKSLRGLI